MKPLPPTGSIIKSLRCVPFRLRLIGLATLSLTLALSGCEKTEGVPRAFFRYTAGNNGNVPCTVQFENVSVRGYAYDWWFGADSDKPFLNPAGTHTIHASFIYTKPGTYEVTLRAYAKNLKEWSTTSQIISVGDTVK